MRKLAVALLLGALLVASSTLPVAFAFSLNEPVPDAYTPIRYIVHQNARPVPGPSGSCVTTLPSASGVAYTPSQVKTAYSYSSANGAGETIAIIDAYGSSTLTSDLSCFDSEFGLPNPSLSVVTPFGKVRGSSSNWGLETSLDVEWAHATAPAAAILLIITPSASLGYLVNDAVPYAVSHGANVISMSWGAYEDQASCSTWQSEANYFQSAVKSGVIPVGASGDNGAYYNNALTVLYPASDPNVVGAGGTSLTTTSSYAWSSESVWDTSTTEATGGGVSTCFAEPSYQSGSGIKITTLAGSSTPAGRAVPDVGYDSDPYTGYWVYDTSGFSGWVQVGGTSAAAPQWAAIFANAQSAKDSVNGGNVHSKLYASGLSSAFHDIAAGNNNYYYASTGYDACTGVGTPIESSVVSGL